MEVLAEERLAVREESESTRVRGLDVQGDREFEELEAGLEFSCFWAFSL